MIAREKRDKLAKSIPDNSLMFLAGKSEIIRNGDVHYPFRQDSDFLLLTGCDVPDILLVGVKQNGEVTWILYSDPISEHEKIWGTARFSHDELRELSDITDIREMSYWKGDMVSWLEKLEHIFLRETLTDREKALLKKVHIIKYKEHIIPIDSLLRSLRMIKSEGEITCMREAIAVTKEAYNKIRANIKPQMYEYEIEAIIASVYRSHHLTEAYPTIVASGPNACTLHYTKHDRKIQEGELVLIDFGAEYRGYAADITRVFPVGEMSSRQRAVYTSVLEVKRYAESQIRPGAKKSEYEALVRERMNEELEKLGLIPSSASKGEREVLSRKYYPHSTSHFLGLDVHDVGSREEILEPGMVITCEPGIYIHEEAIGVRLEDDILITPDGCENLSKNIPL